MSGSVGRGNACLKSSEFSNVETGGAFQPTARSDRHVDVVGAQLKYEEHDRAMDKKSEGLCG